jgi:hypothetical protein
LKKSRANRSASFRAKKQKSRPASKRNAAGGENSRRAPCYGAFVAGIAGAFVEGVVVDISSCFWQPVNNPAQTRPNIATNMSSFFMRFQL